MRATAHGLLANKRVSPEFLAQCSAIDTENTGSLALITLRVIHNRLEQGSLHFAYDQIVQFPGTIAGSAL